MNILNKFEHAKDFFRRAYAWFRTTMIPKDKYPEISLIITYLEDSSKKANILLNSEVTFNKRKPNNAFKDRVCRFSA